MKLPHLFSNSKLGLFARLIGIVLPAFVQLQIQKKSLITFGLASAMAAAAGVMLTMIYSFSPETGADFILKCFAIIIIGGMGSFMGAFISGILLGLAEAFVAGFFTTQWAEAVAYLLLVLVLIIRPTGLMGKANAT